MKSCRTWVVSSCIKTCKLLSETSRLKKEKSVTSNVALTFKTSFSLQNPKLYLPFSHFKKVYQLLAPLPISPASALHRILYHVVKKAGGTIEFPSAGPSPYAYNFSNCHKTHWCSFLRGFLFSTIASTLAAWSSAENTFQSRHCLWLPADSEVSKSLHLQKTTLDRSCQTSQWNRRVTGKL